MLVGPDLPPALYYYYYLFCVNIKHLRPWNTSGWKCVCQRLTQRNWTNVVISLLLQLWKQNLWPCPAVCQPFCGQPGSVAAASLTSWSAAPKDDPFDGNALGRLPGWIHDGALPGWGAEPGVGVSTRFSCTEQHSKTELTWIYSLIPKKAKDRATGWARYRCLGSNPCSSTTSLSLQLAGAHQCLPSKHLHHWFLPRWWRWCSWIWF